TFSFSAHSLQSLVSVSLAPGTQWSQNPTLSLPAAKAPCTNGAESAAGAPAAAAPCKTGRRVYEVFPQCSPPLRADPLAGFFFFRPRRGGGWAQYAATRVKSDGVFAPPALVQDRRAGSVEQSRRGIVRSAAAEGSDDLALAPRHGFRNYRDLRP